MFSAFRKYHFRYIRSLLRGYQILRDNNRLSLFHDIRNHLNNVVLFDKSILSNYSTVCKSLDGDIIIRQFIISLLLNRDFNKAILYSISTKRPIIYPLPTQWQLVLEEKFNLKVNHTLSSLLFVIIIVQRVVYGVAEFIIQLNYSLKRKSIEQYNKIGRYAYFVDLKESNLPTISGNYKYGIISSYVIRFPKPRNIDSVCLSVKNVSSLKINGLRCYFLNSPIPPVTSYKLLFKTIVFSFIYFLVAFFDILRFKWAKSIMLREIIKSFFYTNSKKNIRPKQILFHNSEWVYRPLWTYMAEKEGCDVLLYFYSTNNERLQNNGVVPAISYSWQITTWPKFLVWNIYQADFIRKAIGRNDLAVIVGNISFQFSNSNLNFNNKPFVAVFDIQPVRETIQKIAGEDNRYYVPDVANQFIDDIIDIASTHLYYVVFKQKRDIGKRLDSAYRNNIRKHVDNKNIILIASSNNPEEIIKDCSLVISMPFTSTAIIGQNLNKPSIFYDPTGMIEKDDRAAHGIQIVTGKQELAEVFKRLHNAASLSLQNETT